MSNDNLYVVKRTIINPKSPTGPTFSVTLPAVFTDLQAAKEEAKSVLRNEGYDVEFFPVYEVKNVLQEEWKHADSVVVYARGPSDEQFKVEIDTVPNTLHLKGDNSGRVKERLYYVLQTIIEYNEDRSGTERYSIVMGSCVSRQQAQEQALRVLLSEDTKQEDFVEYDEYADGSEGPFGADVVVHAVKEGGQNILVSIVADD